MKHYLEARNTGCSGVSFLRFLVRLTYRIGLQPGPCLNAYCLKQLSRCHFRYLGCGRCDGDDGGMALPV